VVINQIGKMKYKCTYTSGSGEEFEDGIWEEKVTPKTRRLTKIEEYMSGIYAMHEVGQTFRVGGEFGNPVRDHEDGTFTVYFKRAGTPYYFEPL